MSIGKTKIIGFSPARIKKEAEEYLVSVQTEKLIEYAKEEIVKLGNKIQEYSSRNHMDRTGNLLNSLCWGVYYQGKRKGSGFFRPETLQNKGIEGDSESYLHEFFERTDNINGRQLAQEFIKNYKGYEGGWTVFFAILAPYWGYWESGFNMVHGKGKNKRTSFRQFAVMAQLYDEVRNDLKPAKTKFEVTKDIAYVKPYYIKFKTERQVVFAAL